MNTAALIGRLTISAGVILLALAAQPAAPARGATAYYVSPAGNDANPGTLAQPFRTVQKCADVAIAGDTCYIRAGVYRETVRPANSGVSGAPITFKPYNGELVVISGADVITGPWTLHSGAIYRAIMPWDVTTRTLSAAADNQVWVDGVSHSPIADCAGRRLPAVRVRPGLTAGAGRPRHAHRQPAQAGQRES